MNSCPHAAATASYYAEIDADHAREEELERRYVDPAWIASAWDRVKESMDKPEGRALNTSAHKTILRERVLAIVYDEIEYMLDERIEP